MSLRKQRRDFCDIIMVGKGGGKTIGQWGEDLACKYLSSKGFVVVEKNFHTTHGELDIVARRGGDYYGIEVKTRVDKWLANDSAITPMKKRRLQKTLGQYCFKRGLDPANVFLAGIIVMPDYKNKKANVRWFLIY